MQQEKKRSYVYKLDKVILHIKSEQNEPPHPGMVFKKYAEVLQQKFELPANMIAETLGITRTSYYDFINCKTGISPEMSVRLGRATSTDARFWWKLNTDWQFWKALRDVELKVGIEQLPKDYELSGILEQYNENSDFAGFTYEYKAVE